MTTSYHSSYYLRFLSPGMGKVVSQPDARERPLELAAIIRPQDRNVILRQAANQLDREIIFAGG